MCKCCHKGNTKYRHSQIYGQEYLVEGDFKNSQTAPANIMKIPK